ncbi:helix-turn-helix transcriptional regulator [Streptococcus suis]|uniref:helix-turn-helix transcriptional regulator n=1 Tax=Streptococcus suis TaxID=1307 RepID=UPI0038B75232
MQLLLYEARKKAGYTQKDIADKLGISETAYRQKELDQYEFKLTEMFKIADILDKDIGVIFTRKTSRKVE